MGSLEELKERVCKANIELNKHNVVVYTFGNVSGIDREKGIVAIKGIRKQTTSSSISPAVMLPKRRKVKLMMRIK